LLTLCFLSSLVMPVVAYDWDLTEGSINIGFKEDNKQYVTQNSNEKQDDSPVITSGGQDTSHTITVKTGEDQTAHLTINDVSIVTDQYTSGIDIENGFKVEMTVTGTNTVDMTEVADIRTCMPTGILQLAAEYEVTLTIQWTGGEDIVISPDHGITTDAETILLAELAELLKK